MVEVPGEGDLVADLGLVVVDPRIGQVRDYFTYEVFFNVIGKRDVFGIAECWVGFGVAL